MLMVIKENPVFDEALEVEFSFLWTAIAHVIEVVYLQELIC